MAADRRCRPPPAPSRGQRRRLLPFTSRERGEPPGAWTGRGVAELGLQPGGIVKREVFERLYGQHLDPRDPSGQARLGRAPGRFRSAEDIYAALLAAEPEATAERRAQLLLEAKAQVRTPDLYWDATFTCRSRSPCSTPARWPTRLRPPSGATWSRRRTGGGCRRHLGRDHGRQRGRSGVPAARGRADPRRLPPRRPVGGRPRWVIASFRQHTSRDGDPQLHVHNLILHKVLRESDGQWRALDSMSLYRHRPAASAIAALATENALTRRFGVRWVQRPDGHGREIAGVEQALMDSSPPGGRASARSPRAWRKSMRRSSGAPPTRGRWPACASGPTTPPGAAKTPARSTSQRWCADGRRRPAPARQVPSNPSPQESWARASPPRRRAAGPGSDQQKRTRAAHRRASTPPHPGSGRRAAGRPVHLDRSRPDPPPRRAPPRPGRRDDRAAGRRPAPHPRPPGAGDRGGHAGRAGMAARPRQPAPRLRGKRLHPARRRPLRHQRAAHPGRPPPRPRARARRAAPGPATAARLLGAQQAQLEAQLQAHSHRRRRDHRAHRLRAAPGPGRRRFPRAHLRPPRRGHGRPGRLRQDPDRRRDGARLARRLAGAR